MANKPKPFTLSTERVNSYRMKVLTQGIDTSEFLRNPVMLYMHERGNVIGAWDNLRTENNELLGDPVFDTEDEAAKRIAGKVSRGFLKGASIGVHIVKHHWEGEGEDEVCIIEQCTLLEVSIVDIPSNKSSLRLYDTQGRAIMDAGAIELALPKTQQSSLTRTTMDLKLMATALGLTEGATETDILAAAKANTGAASELARLKASIATQQKQRATLLVDAAIADKRIDATKRETFLSLAEEKFDLFEATLAAIPAPVTLKEIAGGTPTSVAVREDRKDWTMDDWRKKDPDGLLKLSQEKWDDYANLFEKFYGEKPDK